jgi:phosphatidate cytidylyltransferase
LRAEKKSEVDPDTGFGAIPAAGTPAASGFGGHNGQQDPGERHDDVPGAVQEGPVTERRSIRTGRNLPAAIGVGLLMGGLVVLTLFWVKATFLLYVGIILAVALWELSHALQSRDVHLPLVPIVAGGVAMVTLAYWLQARWALGALGLTGIAVLGWRLRGGADGYVRDVTAGIFTLLYLPLAAVFVALMLAEPDGSRRAFIFVVLTVCSDTGAYLAGILIGKHPMVPSISPKKTWEGLGGGAVLCLATGAVMVPGLLGGHVWQGLLLGAAAVAVASLGDLVESMIKRDLQIKDMGHLLPGHGGIMDRLDSLVVMAPVVWLLLAVFVPSGHAV